MNALEFQNVARRYGRPPRESLALEGVTFSLRAGEAAALLGASGSGKTTLLNLAAGLDRPDAGSVLLMGEPLEGLSQGRLAQRRKRGVGFVFQMLNLLPTLTAAENVELPMALAGMPAGERADRARELLARAGLGEKARAFPTELSAGQQQRVAVLRAVAHRPALVLMDEPTSALDTARAGALVDLVLELNRTEQATILLATHDTRIASRLPRTLSLLDGRVVADSQEPARD